MTMNRREYQQLVDERAFAMLGLSPEQREQLFRGAFDQTLAKHPGLTDIPPSIVDFMAAVMQRVAEFEQLPGGTA
jgi:hypothetical protein